MRNKLTEELYQEIKRVQNIESYLDCNHNELSEQPFYQYLNNLLDVRNYKKSDVISRSGLNKTYAYHVFSGEKSPSRDKVIALGFGFQMGVEDMQRLLRFSGNRALYPRDKRDSVILFAVNKAKDIISCNVLLNDLGLNILE